MAYRVGYCPQCNEQIMVRDTNGIFNSFKPNFRQAYLLFQDGLKLKTIICAHCLENPDYQKLMDAILDPESEAADEKGKRDIRLMKKKIEPERIEVNGKIFVEDKQDEFEEVERPLPIGIAQWNLRLKDGK